MRQYNLILILSILLFYSCEPEQQLYAGKKITSSLTLAKDTFLFAGVPIPDIGTDADPTLLIEGRDLVIDFGGSVLMGREDLSRPEDFQGIAIHVMGGSNIKIKNLNVHGYAVALFAEGVHNLQLENCNFSYLRRVAVEELNSNKTFSKEISSTNPEWMQAVAAGAGVVLHDCDKAHLRQLQIHHAQNGLLLDQCDSSWIYNNKIQFNAGLGIGLYESKANQLLFNALDWNFVTGDRPKEMQGGVVFLGESQNNTLAYNSITHSGSDQIFSDVNKTADLLGGNHANQIISNDFSYAPNDGIIKTIEGGNHFAGNILVGCGGGTTEQVEKESSRNKNIKSIIQAVIDTVSLPDDRKGQNPFLRSGFRKGCDYKIFDQYGPYDYSYPHLELRGVDQGGVYRFTIFGPPGNWEAKGGNGFQRMSLKRGTIPATLVLQADSTDIKKSVELEYIGPAFTDVFGRKVDKGQPTLLQWQE